MAFATNGGLEIDGLEAFQRRVSRAADKDLKKRMGRAHKRIGEKFASWLNPRPDPRAVGTGRGADVRPSASRSAVRLMAGGSHREDSAGPDAPLEQWGRKPARRIGETAPPRPHIIGTAEDHLDELELMYAEETMAALEPAFAEGRIDG